MKARSTVLTGEERDVLMLGALQPSGRHLSNSEIAQRLGISESKVKTLIHQACIKLNANNRNQAILLALRRGEINLGDLFSLDELTELFGSLGSDTLKEIARLARSGQAYEYVARLDKQITRTNKRQDGILTSRERDVIILASYGLTNQEMAGRLSMSVSAVKTFLYRAFKKLGARKRADAVMLAAMRREIGVDEIFSADEMIDLLVPLGAESIEMMAESLEQRQRDNPLS